MSMQSRVWLRMWAGRGRNRMLAALAGFSFAAWALFARATPQVPSATSSISRSGAMPELKSRHLFTIKMKLPPTLELGATPAGNRRVFAVSSGEFSGERLRGEVLPQASSDLLLVRADGAS